MVRIFLGEYVICSNMENDLSCYFSQCWLNIILQTHHLCSQKALNINFSTLHVVTSCVLYNAITHYKYPVNYLCVGVWWFNISFLDTIIFRCHVNITLMFSKIAGIIGHFYFLITDIIHVVITYTITVTFIFVIFTFIVIKIIIKILRLLMIDIIMLLLLLVLFVLLLFILQLVILSLLILWFILLLLILLFCVTESIIFWK